MAECHKAVIRVILLSGYARVKTALEIVFKIMLLTEIVDL